MACSAERLIEALIAVDLAEERRGEHKRASRARKATYVLTVSRGYGSLGKDLALALAGRLGVRACDRTILEMVARRLAVDVDLVKTLDERVRRTGIKPWKALFPSASLDEQRFHEHLVKVVLNIAGKGGVIVGRGAHLILGPERAFRVRIVGSLDRCAERITGREQIGLDAARDRVRIVDAQRAEYIEQVFGVSASDDSVYDLLLNSDRFSIEQMVDLVLVAMRIAGYDIREEMLKRA